MNAYQLCIYAAHNLYLKYLCTHISPSTSQAESSVANVCPQSSHILIYLLMCKSLFSKAPLYFWCRCWGVIPRLSPGPCSGAGQVAPVSRKEAAAPWGEMCCLSVPSSVPCPEQWSELQNIASRLQGRLQRAFLIFWHANKHYGWKHTFLKHRKYRRLC